MGVNRPEGVSLDRVPVGLSIALAGGAMDRVLIIAVSSPKRDTLENL